MCIFTTEEVIPSITDIAGDGVKSSKENMFREEQNARFDPAHMEDCPEGSFEEGNSPSTSRGRRCGQGRKNVMWKWLL